MNPSAESAQLGESVVQTICQMLNSLLSNGISDPETCPGKRAWRSRETLYLHRFGCSHPLSSACATPSIRKRRFHSGLGGC
jgi:hypothetical protein